MLPAAAVAEVPGADDIVAVNRIARRAGQIHVRIERALQERVDVVEVIFVEMTHIVGAASQQVWRIAPRGADHRVNFVLCREGMPLSAAE
jgi:hypothetical protein